jgi:uncharacterized protein (TIGR02996 family)
MRWEATLEGHHLQVLMDDDQGPRGREYDFPSIEKADDFLTMEIDRLLDEGFYVVNDVVPVPTHEIIEQFSSYVCGDHRNPELLETIAEDPFDIDRYLVYADWLQEHQEARGHLITLQHQNPFSLDINPPKTRSASVDASAITTTRAEAAPSKHYPTKDRRPV